MKKKTVQSGKHFKHGEAPVGTPKELIDPLGPFDGYVKLGNKTIITRRDKPDPNATIGGIASHTWGAEAEIPEAHFNVTLPATQSTDTRVDSSAARRELEKALGDAPIGGFSYNKAQLIPAHSVYIVIQALANEVRRAEHECEKLERLARNYLERQREQEMNKCADEPHQCDAASIAARDGAI